MTKENFASPEEYGYYLKKVYESQEKQKGSLQKLTEKVEDLINEIHLLNREVDNIASHGEDLMPITRISPLTVYPGTEGADEDNG